MLLVIKTDQPVIFRKQKSNVQSEEGTFFFFLNNCVLPDTRKALLIYILVSDSVLKGSGFSAESFTLHSSLAT